MTQVWLRSLDQLYQRREALVSTTKNKQILILSLFILYTILARCLRYRRARAIASKHGLQTRSSFCRMTADQAQDILKDLVELEFPTVMGFSIIFALFKTYGFPSVSSLLVTTGELSNVETASKRTADTGVLLLEFCLNPPSSKRSLEAIARTNYLHRKYIKAGRISNSDMLYTLSVFALEPIRWVKQYEWRSMTDLELCAVGTFWKSLGDKMEIDLSPLPSSHNSHGGCSGWTDGLDFLDEIRVWSEGYEKQHMVPDEQNHKLATAHLDVIFVNIPERFRYLGHYLVSAIADERLRKAMKLPESPQILRETLTLVFTLRKLLLRYLCLPRLEIFRKSYISSGPEESGRFSAKEYLSYPWYVKPTWKRRWGIKAWQTWMLRRKLPGDDGFRYRPEGYVIKQVGPERFELHGAMEMDKDLDRMKALVPEGCPFAPRKR